MNPKVEQLEDRCVLSNAFNNAVIGDSLAASLQKIADIQIANNIAAGLVPNYPVTYAVAAPLAQPLEVPALPVPHADASLVSSLVPPLPFPVVQPATVQQWEPFDNSTLPPPVIVPMPVGSPIPSSHLSWALQAISDAALGLPVQPWSE